MIYQHQGLSSGRWQGLSFLEQMANIGSEVGRALNWRAKNNLTYFQKASDRALELIDLTLQGALSPGRFREVARVREILADHLFGENEFGSTDEGWKKYFEDFAKAARKDR